MSLVSGEDPTKPIVVGGWHPKYSMLQAGPGLPALTPETLASICVSTCLKRLDKGNLDILGLVCNHGNHKQQCPGACREI
jgi:hypothetical protein